MRFLSRINRHYFWTLIILVFLLSFGGYFLLSNIINDEMQEDISANEYAIIQEIKTQNNLPNIFPIIETKKISPKKITPKAYKKIYVSEESEDELEPYIEYTNCVEIENQWYLIKIRHSLLDTNDLILAIALPLLFLLVLAFAFSFFLTKKLNKTIWKGFEENLKVIESFSFNNIQKLDLQNSGIEEFDRLNDAILKMTLKLGEDYLSLKEFTENASHEIQTPLSIILLNLEELLQSDLSEQAFKQVVASINALKRLSALNQSLVLLAKIENHQFDGGEVVILNNILKQKIQEFTPLFEAKNLKIEFESSRDFSLMIDQQLAEILISNLLSNAVKHNIQNGFIKINIEDKTLNICNTGSESRLTDQNIFNRFTKQNSESYGLGLAIVKKICDKHKLEIHYQKNELHCFIIDQKL